MGKRPLGSGNVLFLSVGVDYTNVFSLRTFIELYTHFVCVYILYTHT
jgi:hypothetical protein